MSITVWKKNFEGNIGLEGTEEGFHPITGEAGRREKKKTQLTILIEKINEKYGTNFTEMDKVLLQLENDYASEEKWQSYARNNDHKTFFKASGVTSRSSYPQDTLQCFLESL